MTPKRIQRRRVKGWKMPANTVCVTRPGKWGNTYKVGGHCWGTEITSEYEAVKLFEGLVKDHGLQYPFIKEVIKKELKGKNLACWCPLVDKKGEKTPCHADILLKIANE